MVVVVSDSCASMFPQPENLLYTSKETNCVLKLTDFGFSNKFQPGKKLTTSCGSLAYSAPEILLGDEYDAPAVGKWKECEETLKDCVL